MHEIDTYNTIITATIIKKIEPGERASPLGGGGGGGGGPGGGGTGAIP